MTPLTFSVTAAAGAGAATGREGIAPVGSTTGTLLRRVVGTGGAGSLDVTTPAAEMILSVGAAGGATGRAGTEGAAGAAAGGAGAAGAAS